MVINCSAVIMYLGLSCGVLMLLYALFNIIYELILFVRNSIRHIQVGSLEDHGKDILYDGFLDGERVIVFEQDLDASYDLIQQIDSLHTDIKQ